MGDISDIIRRSFKSNDDKRDEGLVTPDDIVRYDDICYGTDRVWQVLDIYLPKAFAESRVKKDVKTDPFDSEIQEIEKREKLPVILNVHGGAWVYGTKETYQFYCMSLAQKGFAVVNFTYRLASDFKFPSMIEDTNLVMHYVFENSDKFGFDLDRLYAVGDSAGAHLLSIYAAMSVNPEYAAKFEMKYGDRYNLKLPENLKFRALALNCGKYNFEQDNRITESGDAAILDVLLEDHGVPAEMELMNVYYAVDENFPTCFVMTASDDMLKDQSVRLAGRLAEKKVPFTMKVYGSAEKPLYHVFHCDIRSEDGMKCNDDECRFFSEI